MIHIVCAIDNSYIPYCGVMLASLFHHGKGLQFHIHIISNKLDTKAFGKLTEFIGKKKQKYSHYIVDENILKDAPISHHVSLSTYYRVLIPELLPQDIDKVLYLDSDIFIRKSVKELWEIDISQYHTGAAREFIKQDHQDKLGIPTTYPYFNAGILLINLKKWREDNTTNILINYINEYKNKIIFWDQDALNAVLYKSCYIFSSLWNVTEGFFVHNPIEYDFSEELHKQCISSPYIVHFTGTAKPWLYYVKHPFKKEYLYFLGKTPWKNVKQIGEPLISDYQKFRIELSNLKQYILRKII